MSVWAASLAAAAFGAGDFLGGLAARNGHWSRVVAVALGAGLAVIGLAALFVGPVPAALPMGWCLVAAAGFAVGISLLYRALAAGTMVEVAPISAIVAIVLPALVDIGAGAEVTRNLILGLCAAVLSGVLVTGPPTGRSAMDRRHLCIAVAAGLGFALFYVGLDRIAASGAGLWGLFIVRGAALAALLVPSVLHANDRMSNKSVLAATCGGLFDGLANLLMLVAFSTGKLAQTAAIASIYPVSTILLAMLFLRERPSILQAAGLLLAIPSILLLKST